MSLSREVYRVMEDIVGPENVSEEPATLYSYANPGWLIGILSGGEVFGPLPEAVVLPGSTEEVQKLTKMCNRYKVQFHPTTTGWAPFSCAQRGQILFDLRRMDRILEIDEKNMYVVVEPYVSSARLHTELAKRDLVCPHIAAGSGCSVLAANAACIGMGFTACSMGIGDRNLLGVEWVLPTGDIVRLGTAGAGLGWHCIDGPGPSLKGMMRGIVGSMGGLGTYTKAAIKIYNWLGEEAEEVAEGELPYHILKMPPKFRNYVLTFPSYEEMFECVRQLLEQEMMYAASRAPAFMVATAVSHSNNDIWALWEDGAFQERFMRAYHVIIAGYSEREIEYRDKVLKEILARNNGVIPEEVEDPSLQSGLYSSACWADQTNKYAFRPTGNFTSAYTNLESADMCCAETQASTEYKRSFVDRGLFLDDGDNAWGNTYEQGTWLHVEHIAYYDPADRDSTLGAGENFFAVSKDLRRHKFGAPFYDGILPGPFQEMGAPLINNFSKWSGLIKQAVDPNIIADPAWYPPTEEFYED